MTATESTVNVDPAEIEKFQAIASRWWDPNSEFKPLHDINPLRLDYIEQQAGGLQGRKVVDIGCGPPRISRRRTPPPSMSSPASRCSNMYPTRPASCGPPRPCSSPAEPWCSPPSTAIPRPSRWPSSAPNTCSACCPAAPTNTPQAARNAGLRVTDVSGMSYNPLTRQYRISRDVDVNYLMTCTDR